MLSKEQIERIGRACDELAWERTIAFFLAAVHRTLPVYQVYAEHVPGLRGYAAVHDGLVGVWRVIRRRPGASAALIVSQVESATKEAEADLEKVNNLDDFGLAEALVSESIAAVVSAFRAYLDESRASASDSALGALEVDMVWAEGESDDPGSEGAVSFEGLQKHYGQQIRDISELADTGGDPSILFREISTRAEREGMVYLRKMRKLMAVAE